MSGNSFPIGLSADIAAHLGVLDVVVQEVGLTINVSFPPGGHGDVGPLNLAFAFKPPKGAGLSVDTAVIKGGGFLRFDPDAGEYFGALELSCERTATALVPCYGDLVAAVRGRAGDFQGALTAAFAQLLSDIFVGRIGAAGLPADLVVRGAAPSVLVAPANATLHLELDAALAPLAERTAPQK